VTDLTGQIAAALERSILPSVIARGAALRVISVEDRIVTLELTGSPGAVWPLASRIEAQIRAAVPGLAGVRIVTPGAHPPSGTAQPPPDVAQPPPDVAQPPPDVAQPPPDVAGTLAEQARRILEGEINPAIAAHRGRVVLVSAHDGWVRIRLEGGCQGCSLAEVTVRQGIEPLLRSSLPGLTGVLDVTDHEAGTQPFFSPEKR
jgi:Fe-S cluster biogenesis protein NfuA